MACPLPAWLCSRLEASLASQQEELQSRLAAVQMLGERREALADRLAALQQLCARAQVGRAGSTAHPAYLCWDWGQQEQAGGTRVGCRELGRMADTNGANHAVQGCG